MKSRQRNLVGLLIILLVGVFHVLNITFQESPPTDTAVLGEQKSFASVVKVIDGDTVDVKVEGKTVKVRVIGINTPETVDPRKSVECFGLEASKKAHELLNQKKVRLEGDLTQSDMDRYGRILRYIYLPNGTDFGLTLIKEGYAYEYTYEKPYLKQAEYIKAQKEASESKNGLWGEGNCVEPKSN